MYLGHPDPRDYLFWLEAQLFLLLYNFLYIYIYIYIYPIMYVLYLTTLTQCRALESKLFYLAFCSDQSDRLKYRSTSGCLEKTLVGFQSGLQSSIQMVLNGVLIRSQYQWYC